MVEEIVEKMVTQFVRKPSKSGDDYDFRIPRNNLSLGLIDPTKEYIVKVYERNSK